MIFPIIPYVLIVHILIDKRACSGHFIHTIGTSFLPIREEENAPIQILTSLLGPHVSLSISDPDRSWSEGGRFCLAVTKSRSMDSLQKGGLEQRLVASANVLLESKQCNTQCNGSGSKNMDPVDQDARRSSSESSPDNSVSPSNPRGHEGKPKVMESVHQFRVKCGLLVNNSNFEAFIVACIAFNALMMGIGTYSFVRDDERLEQAFENIDLVFLIIFTLELGLQFVYHGLRLFLDGWLLFDLVIIVMSWSFQSAQIIRAFRIFRAFRLVTRVKTMKNLIVGTFFLLVLRLSVPRFLFTDFTHLTSVRFYQLFLVCFLVWLLLVSC